jgi:hypothetical protein
MDASASADVAGAPVAVPLQCLGGGDAPLELGRDLLLLRGLPIEAVERMWQVLGPSLAETIAPETERLLDGFCKAYQIESHHLARALKACRFVIREAARIDLPAAALAADLDRLCPGDALVQDLVLAGYEPAKARIRSEILGKALADHGNLLTGVSWRVDTIHASERGGKLRAPVAMLTLQYREGAETRRITLQALPEMIVELRGACEGILA